MENRCIELRIHGVTLEGDETFVVLDDKAKDRRLQLPIGPFEASAIVIEMECIFTPRPLTHVLLAEIFEEGGFVLDRVELLGDARIDTRARLLYHKGLRVFEKEARPSDALALALRLGAPVFAEASMIERQERESNPWRRPRILALEDWKAKALRA
jgi:uncharacterized protein